MFRSGRQKTLWLRGTAAVSVFLMVGLLYRPSIAVASAGNVNGRFGTRASAHAAQGGGPSDRSSAALPRRPSERVRARVLPREVRVQMIGAATRPPNDGWNLFDGDGERAFVATGPVRVRAALSAATMLHGVGVYGGSGATLTVSVDHGGGDVTPLAGLRDLALADLPQRWNRFAATATASASVLVLDFLPTAPEMRVPELEIWGDSDLGPDTADDSMADALLTGLPTGMLEAGASPGSASVSAPELGAAGSAAFHVQLSRPPATIGRAFLVYELRGLTRFTAPVRQVNGGASLGGFHAVRGSQNGLQVEEIDPTWLRAGSNEIRFYPADRNDPVGYVVKNLRVVVLPIGTTDAAHMVGTDAADVMHALVDGRRDTGVDGRSARGPAGIAHFAFATPTQPDSLLLALEHKAAGSATIVPMLLGKPDRRHSVAVDLEGLAVGWNRIPLDAITDEVDGVRVSLDIGAEAGGVVSEIRVVGSPRPQRADRTIAVVYPLHRECVDGQAYLRGFVRSGSAGVRPTAFAIDGIASPQSLGRDGSFGAVVGAPSARVSDGGRWEALLEATFPDGQKVARSVPVEGCRPRAVANADPRGLTEDQGAPFGQWVKAGEAARLSFGGATLDIPEGALLDDTRITVRPLTPQQVPATDETLTNVMPDKRGYRFGPHNLKFAKPVKLTLPFDPRLFPAGYTEEDMGSYYFDEAMGRWTRVPTVEGSGAAKTLTAITQHFTDFINATLTTPDHPAADSFNPNSIKDIKAAEPAEGIDIIGSPTPGPDGAVHLSYPIRLPPGPQGLTPPLSVNYNSDGGNGWLGIGWSLHISTIEVDSRFGVPKYSPTEETERYTLDGELLVPDPNQNGGRSGKVVFHRRSEGSFETIIRTGASPLEKGGFNGPTYTWEVVDKQGTHFLYGTSSDARASLTNRGVFRWHLNRVRDAFGNEMQYGYVKAFWDYKNITPQAVDIYPQFIAYAMVLPPGGGFTVPFYTVRFEHENIPNTTEDAVRPDVFTSARSGTLELFQRRLKNIRIFQSGNSDAIRRYRFEYKVGEFGKSLLDTIRVVHGEDPVIDAGNFQEFYHHTFNYTKVGQFESSVLPEPRFGDAFAWGDVGDTNKGLSASNSGTLSATIMGGWGPGACAALHGVIGASFNLGNFQAFSFLPPFNQEVAYRGFMDANGDGLPDWVDAGGIKLNNGKFQPFAPVAFARPPQVGKSDQSFVNFQGALHVLVEAGRIGVGYNMSDNSESATMADMNGDGIADYVEINGGQLNVRLNQGQGFATQVPWDFPSIPISLNQTTIDRQKSQFRLTDPVVRWTAPYTGHVLVTGAIQKLAQAPGEDGVLATVRVPGGTWERTITDTVPCTPTLSGPSGNACGAGTSALVHAGDRIYFQLGSIDDIEDDVVSWNPQISFSDICDVNAANCVALTGDDHAKRAAEGGLLYDFNQSTDFRLAGNPVPSWRSESAGTGTIRITGQVVKTPTPAPVFVEIIRNGNTEGDGGQVIYPGPGDPPQLDAAASTTRLVNPPDITLAYGDRLVFRVRSALPFDPASVAWLPHVEYTNYCRKDQASNANDKASTANTICGAPINCSSSTGGGQCQIQGDPDPAHNLLSADIVSRDVAPFYALAPWSQKTPPTVFVAPQAGTISLTGTFSSNNAGGITVVAQGVNRTWFQSGLTTTGGTGTIPPGTSFRVGAGDEVIFTVYSNTLSAPPGITPVPGSWSGTLAFAGDAGATANQTYTAGVVVPDGRGPISGGYRNWSLAEWNSSKGPFREAALGTRPPDGTEKTGDTEYQLLTQRPTGMEGFPQPLWKGSGLKNFVGAGIMAASRVGKPRSGLSPALRSSEASSITTGGGVLFGLSFSSEDGSDTKRELLDLNGDRYPDAVANSNVFFNDGKGQFVAASPQIDLGGATIRHTSSNQFGATLGISDAIPRKDAQGNNRNWISLLPSLGIGYSVSNTDLDLIDINGDGLPDRVRRTPGQPMFVRLNLGNEFAQEVQWDNPTWEQTGPNAASFVALTSQGLAIALPDDWARAVTGALTDAKTATLRLQDGANNSVGAGYSYFGGNAGASVSRTIIDMIDMNGDGLPDLVLKRPGANYIGIKFNTGVTFLPEQQWPMPAWTPVQNGIPTTLTLENGLTVGFGSNDALSFSESSNLAVAAGYANYVETGITGCWVIEGGASGSGSNTGSDLRFEDIDGDGAPDHVLKLDGNSQVFVKRNPSAGANLLDEIDNPLGGRTFIGYKRLGNIVDPTQHVDMPDSHFALRQITRYSVNTFADITDVDYSTSGANPIPSGFYDRTEREFLGFARMTVSMRGNDAAIERTYDNTSYARKHLLLDELNRQGTLPMKRLTRTYTDTPVVAGSVFPALSSELTLFYEGQTVSPPRSLQVDYTLYDAQGNLKTFIDRGEAGATDDLRYDLTYQTIVDPVTQATFPRTSRITATAGGVTLRDRSAIYGNHGEMSSLTNVRSGGKDPTTGAVLTGAAATNSTWGFTYQGNGNLQTSTDPNGYTLTYEYDPGTQAHVTKVTDFFGYVSTRGHDLRFGLVSDTTDINGQKQHIDYDLWGRTVGVFGPREAPARLTNPNAPPTIAFEFAISHPQTNPPVAVTFPFWARTMHKDDPRPDSLDTVVFVDGLDRVIQTKKDAEVADAQGVTTVGRVVSGPVIFDAFSRIYQQGQPMFESTGSATTFTNTPMNRPTTFAYDSLSRVRSVLSPDDRGTLRDPGNLPVVQTLTDYNIKTFDGADRLAKQVKDPNGKLRTQYLSSRHEVVGVVEPNTVAGAQVLITTRYLYDQMSQLTKVTDHNGNQVTSIYDSLGQMVSVTSPDTGTTEYRYDIGGNLGAKLTAQLAAATGAVPIKYIYDHGRLKTVDYPTSADANYTYGAPGAANGQAGRISQIVDESGTERNFYDELGNVRHMEKVPATMSPAIPTVTYGMDYTYDQFGRMQTMTYPDGEVVTYAYNAGGLLNHVQGVRSGTTVEYVKNVGYDEFEQRKRLELGNGTTTDYQYEPSTRRLSTLNAKQGGSTLFQSLSYGYDFVGNVLTLNNGIPVPAPVTPNGPIVAGPTEQTFQYDDLYQLTSATGRYRGCACGCSNERRYTFTQTYDVLGNIRNKTQNDIIIQPSGISTTQTATSYNVAYSYLAARPHGPSAIGTQTLTYDLDGNQKTNGAGFGPARTLTWTEDDRLRSEVDGSFTNTFLYDVEGNRTHKRRTTLETVYVNPYYVVRNGVSETKHVVMGDARVASVVAPIGNRNDPHTAAAGVFFYYHPDHISSTNYTTGGDGSLLQHDEYFPSGEVWFQEAKNNDARNTQPYLFNAKELDETGLYYFGARYYNPRSGIWVSPDPILASYMHGKPNQGVFTPANLGLYTYSWNNPVVLRDLNGEEPVKALAGTAADARRLLDTSRSQIGLRSGKAGAAALIRLGQLDPKTGKPENAAAVTGGKQGRYVYTEQGGWIDVEHFLFYAGYAQEQKVRGEQKPFEAAVDAGRWQETHDDRLSSFSYEDLPSDAAGAYFGAYVFDPNSKASLSEQAETYLKSLGAAKPADAPNWGWIPKTEKDAESQGAPTVTNKTTNPLFTKRPQ